MIVNHRKFGKGKVKNQDDKNVTVQFEKKEHTFLKIFCNLTLEDGSKFDTKEAWEVNNEEMKDHKYVPKAKAKKWYELAEDLADKKGLFFDSRTGNMYKLK